MNFAIIIFLFPYFDQTSASLTMKGLGLCGTGEPVVRPIQGVRQGPWWQEGILRLLVRGRRLILAKISFVSCF